MQCDTFELDRKALLSEAERYITPINTLFETKQFISIMSIENHTIINVHTKYTYACFEKIVVSQTWELSQVKGPIITFKLLILLYMWCFFLFFAETGAHHT